jgi:hypothetical protein
MMRMRLTYPETRFGESCNDAVRGRNYSSFSDYFLQRAKPLFDSADSNARNDIKRCAPALMTSRLKLPYGHYADRGIGELCLAPVERPVAPVAAEDLVLVSL